MPDKCFRQGFGLGGALRCQDAVLESGDTGNFLDFEAFMIPAEEGKGRDRGGRPAGAGRSSMAEFKTLPPHWIGDFLSRTQCREFPSCTHAHLAAQRFRLCGSGLCGLWFLLHIWVHVWGHIRGRQMPEPMATALTLSQFSPAAVIGNADGDASLVESHRELFQGVLALHTVGLGWAGDVKAIIAAKTSATCFNIGTSLQRSPLLGFVDAIFVP